MRYYSIEFSNPNGGFPSGIPSVYTSHQQGIYNPACPEIQFDIPNTFADGVITPTHLRIHNVPVDMIKKARQYNGMNVVIKAGFKPAVPGLNTQMPLEKPEQAGIIGQGVVQTCYGNWLGTDLVLDFLIWPNANLGSANTIRSFNTGTTSPATFQFVWDKGSLAEAIYSTLHQNFGISKVTGTISPVLSNPPQVPINMWFTSYARFANQILDTSVLLVNPPGQNKDGTGVYQKYLGVKMAFKGNEVVLFDGTESPVFVQLKFDEFIGQPTWVTDSGMVQSVHPMRNDIWLGYEVRYPAGIPSIIAPQYSPTLKEYNINESAAPLKVFQVRHLGRFRGTGATDWATYVTAGSAIRIQPNNPQASKVKVQTYEYTPNA